MKITRNYSINRWLSIFGLMVFKVETKAVAAAKISKIIKLPSRMYLVHAPMHISDYDLATQIPVIIGWNVR